MLAAQLLEGLDYLHAKRIVHRDVKPANLLLMDTSATRLKIGDFNSARQIGSNTWTAGNRCAMLTDRGTASFRSPELVLGRVWNEGVDIWAAGMTIFFMVEGQLPFRIEDVHVLSLLSQGKLPRLEQATLHSEPMLNLVLQCLAVDFHDRPPAMELLLHPVVEPFASRPSSCPPCEKEQEVFQLNASCGLIASQSGPGDSRSTGNAPLLMPPRQPSLSSISTVSSEADLEDLVRGMEWWSASTTTIGSGECSSPGLGADELRILRHVADNRYRRTVASMGACWSPGL